MDQDDIYSISADAVGWRTLTDGQQVWLGQDCDIEADAVLSTNLIVGSGCLIDRNVRIGKNVTFANRVFILGEADIGDGVT